MSYVVQHTYTCSHCGEKKTRKKMVATVSGWLCRICQNKLRKQEENNEHIKDRQLLAEYNLVLCDKDCSCGEASYLVFSDVGKAFDPRLPAWINGAPLEEVKRWIGQQKQDTTP